MNQDLITHHDRKQNCEPNLFSKLKDVYKKEGIIIYTSPSTARVGLSREILMELHYLLINHRSNFTFNEIQRFFGVYIFNWNNNESTNPEVRMQNLRLIRENLEMWVFHQYNSTAFGDSINSFLQYNQTSSGMYIEINNFRSPSMIFERWNNQICL